MGRKKTRFQWDSESTDEEEVELPSRRDLKEDNRYKAAAKSLLGLKPERWSQLPLSDELHEALLEVHRLKQKGNVRGGLRRQVNRVATVLRQDDLESILAAMEED